MSSLIRQGRRHSIFRANGKGHSNNNGNTVWEVSDREFLLNGDNEHSSQQDNMTFMQDFWIAIRSSWRAALLVGSGCGILALVALLLHTHDHGNPMRSNSSSVVGGDWRGGFHGWQGQQSPLSTVSVATPRPIPTVPQQITMRDVYMHASVTILPSEKENNNERVNNKLKTTVVLQGSQQAGDTGVSENAKRSSELRKAIEDTLTSYPWVTVYDATWKWGSNVWEGFVLYCNLLPSGNNTQQNDDERIISYNNKDAFTTTVQEADAACNSLESQAMDLARAYQQFVVYKWFPHVWGNSNNNGINITHSSYHHTSIIQSVIPTRTGLNSIRSKTVVYGAEAITGTGTGTGTGTVNEL